MPHFEKGEEMPLKDLVTSLQTVPSDKIRDIGTKIADERVIYPSDWRDGETDVKGSYRKGDIHRKDDEQRAFDLKLSAFFQRDISVTAPLLTDLMKQVQGLQFEQKTFEVETGVYWPEGAFTQECNLGDLTEVRVRSSFYAHDPTKVRIGFPGQSHEISFELNGKTLQISATGDYSTLLPKVITELKPQFATIRISPEDAKRWLSKTKGWRKKLLERVLKPQKRNYLGIQMGGGISFDEKNEIEVMVVTSALPGCAEAIGKPLINEVTGEQSFVVNLTKTFLRQSSALPALQKTLEIIGALNTQTVFGHPLLTTAKAKEMLDKEVDLVSRSYGSMFFFGANTHKVRRPVVLRLVREHFGDEIVRPFEAMSPKDYLEFLRSLGFKYNNELDEKKEYPHVLKERYLFQFFTQSYAKDPSKSVEKYRQSYVNSSPKVEVTGKVRRVDASRISKLSLPEKSILMGFALKPAIGSEQGYDEISITRLLPHSDIHFWLRLSLDSCKLVDIQEEVCKKWGVVCN